VSVRDRIEVMHGPNLDQLGRRDPALYGGGSFDELERRIAEYARELKLTTRFFQTNHEGEFIEHLHDLDGLADAVLINAGSWTHYSWAIRDALELARLPSVEVHLSDIHAREEWRRFSVFEGLCVAQISGKGAEGYREGLQALKEELA